MPTLTGYDPWAHAHQLHIHIHHARLQHAYGLWIPSHNTIIIQPGLPSYIEQSILAHEIVHAEYNDPPGWHAKHERRANRVAADRLIDEPTMLDLLKTTNDYDHVCIELGVTRELLATKLNEGIKQ